MSDPVFLVAVVGRIRQHVERSPDAGGDESQGLLRSLHEHVRDRRQGHRADHEGGSGRDVLCLGQGRMLSAWVKEGSSLFGSKKEVLCLGQRRILSAWVREGYSLLKNGEISTLLFSNLRLASSPPHKRLLTADTVKTAM